MNSLQLRIPAFLIVSSLCVFGCDNGVEPSTDVAGDPALEPATAAASISVGGKDCIAACEGRHCGPDPVCGASCGSCGDGAACDEPSGQCNAVCVPDCTGRVCGPDPVCGVSCGSCGVGAGCDEPSGQCNAVCVPDCTARACGPDPVCGVSCGSCGDAAACDEPSGQCSAVCVPDCGGRSCGLDPKCGTSCGTCDEGAECVSSGICIGKHAPIAVAIASKAVACDANTGTSNVVLDGTKSSDPDGDSLQFVWTEGVKVLASTSLATVSLGAGVHTITLTVRDSTGLSSSATTSANVITSAPVFTSSIQSVSIASCSTDAPVVLPIPAALDRCASGPVTVSGEVISKNGSKVSIPVAAGAVVLPAGNSIVRWRATTGGLTTTADQVVTITERWGVFASSKLEIADGVKIVRSSGGYGKVVNSGAGGTWVGVEAKIGSILSAAPVTLRDRAKVFGSVTTASTLTKLNSVWVRDAVSERASLVVPSVPSLPSSIPTSTTDVIVQTGRLRSISAGAYRAVSVASRSTLRLAAGTYYVDSLNLEPQSTLALVGDGAVQIYVRSLIVFRGTISDPKNATGDVQLSYLGTNPVYLEAPFFGVLVAPKASIALRAVSTPHVGSFFAKEVFIDAHASVTARPIGCQ